MAGSMQGRAPAHLFLCSSARLLPRWSEAFESARASRPSTKTQKAQKIDLLWLRLTRDQPVAGQLGRAQEFSQTPFIVLSDMPSDDEALEVFSAGARGYCNTHAAPALLRQIADVALQGGLWIGESLMQRLVGATARSAAPISERATDIPAWHGPLTGREIEVARTLSSGASNKEIARALGITERTVKSHVGSILEKLRVRDRLQLSIVINELN
jgi:DNA-binding NarL/FixJ family response regulator